MSTTNVRHVIFGIALSVALR